MKRPRRHWRSYGPAAQRPGRDAKAMRAFASWFLRVECERCGKVAMVNESHAARWRDRTLADILRRMRHDGCGGLAGKAESLTGIEGASSRPVQRIAFSREG